MREGVMSRLLAAAACDMKLLVTCSRTGTLRVPTLARQPSPARHCQCGRGREEGAAGDSPAGTATPPPRTASATAAVLTVARHRLSARAKEAEQTRWRCGRRTPASEGGVGTGDFSFQGCRRRSETPRRPGLLMRRRHGCGRGEGGGAAGQWGVGRSDDRETT